MIKKRLLAPGPTTVPDKVLLSMAEPVIHHRTPQFTEILGETEEGLKYVFQTKNDVYILAASGTGAMEASIVNLLSPGDKALVIQGGKFGERFTEIAKAYNIEVETIDVAWGRAVDPGVVKERLSADNSIKAVYATLCETSTGVVNDIQALGKIVAKSAAVLAVDVISGLGAMEFNADDWGVDVVIGGSQKGLMMPPGLAMISVSKKAWELVEKSASPRYYLDLRAYKKSMAKIDTPYTSGVTL
ncbi:MAG: alanine--glyoxylate aminotransferase family protein, partial [Candidatus Omnitrophica bacterium]|nr:alanine--glyoxylate aminotransferase family protein [Candidatus Omnitrophota bacterium]